MSFCIFLLVFNQKNTDRTIQGGHQSRSEAADPLHNLSARSLHARHRSAAQKYQESMHSLQLALGLTEQWEAQEHSLREVHSPFAYGPDSSQP